MKYSINQRKLNPPFIILLLGITGFSTAQTTLRVTGETTKEVSYRSNGRSSILISGTSTLHDWTMKSGEGVSNATFTTDSDGNVVQLNALSFSVRAESILSEHSLMNTKTYEALKTKTNPTISFVATSATVYPATGNNFMVKSKGKLTIAGVSKGVELTATGQFDKSDGSITCTGSKKIRMTEFGIKPPSVMLNTIKTGDDITIDFIIRFIHN